MRSFLVVSACLLCVVPTMAAKPKAKTSAKSSTAKTTVKSTKTKPTNIVKGTTQLPGENAQFGVTYTINSSDKPYNFTVKSMEYTIGPVYLDQETYVAEPGKRLLVVHFTLQNPNKNDLYGNSSQIDITAVDAKNGNWEAVNRWAIEETSQTLDQDLKPGQKVNLRLVVSVPASESINKIMIIPTDRKVLRYNLTGKIKQLEAQYADPKYPNLSVPYERFQAVMGKDVFPMQKFSVRVDSCQMAAATDETDARYVVTATFTNHTKSEEALDGSQFAASVIDTDGSEWSYDGILWAQNSQRGFNGNIKPGQQVTVRLPFVPVEGATPASFMIDDNASRPITVKL